MSTLQFDQVGVIYPTNQFLKLIITVNISSYVHYCEELLTIADHLTAEFSTFENPHNISANFTGDFSPYSFAKISSFNSSIDELKESCTSISSLPGARRMKNFRPKRQAAIFFGALALGTAFGAFGHEILSNHHLQQEEDLVVHVLKEQDVRVNQLANQTSKLAKSVERLSRITRSEINADRRFIVMAIFTHTVQYFVIHEKLLTTGILAAYNHRLSNLLLDHRQLQEVHSQLVQKAAQLGANLPTKQQDQLYQLPVSFRVNSALQIIVHIPLTGVKLQLLHLRNSHVVLTNGSSAILCDLKEAKNFLAITEENDEYAEMSSAHLKVCLQLGKAYFCRIEIMQKKTSPSCLLSIFKGDNKGVFDHCDLHLSTQAWHIIKARRDRIMLFVTSSMSVRLQCSNGTTVTSVSPGMTELSVPRTCALESDYFKYQNSHDQEVAIEVTIHITWDLQQFRIPFPLSTIPDVKADLLTSGIVPANSLHLLIEQHLRNRDQQRRLQILWWSLGLSICVLTIGIIIFLVLCIYRRQTPVGK
jgi:hypothetical protein